MKSTLCQSLAAENIYLLSEVGNETKAMLDPTEPSTTDRHIIMRSAPRFVVSNPPNMPTRFIDVLV